MGAAEGGSEHRLRRMMVEYGRPVLGRPLAASLRCTGREPACRHAFPALRNVRDGRSRPVGRWAGHRCRRVGVRGHARIRSRVPRRALRGRPARGARARRGGAPRRARGCARRPPPVTGRPVARAQGAVGVSSARSDARTGRPAASRRTISTTGGCRGPGSRGARRSSSAASPSRSSPFSTSACRSSPGSTTRGRGSRQGDPLWLLACVLFELISFSGYVWLFRGRLRAREREDRLARRATRSRWPGWRRRGCSPRAARAERR